MTSSLKCSATFWILSLCCAVIEDHQKVDDAKPDSAMEAEAKAAQQRALIPLEDRVQQFKEMLAEKEVYQNISCSINFYCGTE